MVTLQRRRAAQSSPDEEELFFLDTLLEYQWARDVAGLAQSTLDGLIKPVIEVCEYYALPPWQLVPRHVDRYFAGPGKRAEGTILWKIRNIDAYFAFLEQRYAGEIFRRFGASVESPINPFNRPRHRGDFGLRVPPSRRALKEFFGDWRADLPSARKELVACRDYVMAKITYISGVRARELCGVKIKDLHWEAGQFGRFLVMGKGARGSGPQPREAFMFAAGRCRACVLQTREAGLSLYAGVQLALTDPAVHLSRQAAKLGFAGDDGRLRRKILKVQQTDPAEVSPHRLAPGQTILFTAARDWTPVLQAERLPALDPTAAQLLEEFRQLCDRQSLNKGRQSELMKSLRVLLAWLGAEAPIPESDIRALGRHDGVSIRRPLRFLADRGLVIHDSSRQIEPRQHAVDRLVKTLPAGIGSEVQRWIVVMRGQGRREHPARPYKTIRNYLTYLLPVLEEWTTRYVTLRQVTRDDVLAAIKPEHGPDIHHRIVALRSLFKALRQEKVIFADPCRGISLPKKEMPPRPLSSDRLAGLLDKVDGPAARLMTALIANHALSGSETVTLLIEDLYLSTWTKSPPRCSTDGSGTGTADGQDV